MSFMSGFLKATVGFLLASYAGMQVSEQVADVSPELIAERSACGYIVDSDGTPLPDVRVECKMVFLPNNKRLYVAGATKTDERGYFCLYPEYIAPYGDDLDGLVPLGSSYGLWIEPPRDYGLASDTFSVSISEEARIVLSTKGYFHTFAFEDADGPLMFRGEPATFRVFVSRPGKRTLLVVCSAADAGRMLPLGTYKVDDSDDTYGFEPMEVTPESPRRLVFRSQPSEKPANTVYKGRVLDGVTGEPMAGTIVAAGRSFMLTGRGFVDMGEYQWDLIHALPEHFEFDGEIARKAYSRLCPSSGPSAGRKWIYEAVPNVGGAELAMASLAGTFPACAATRTDSDGYFELTVAREDRKVYLVVAEEGYIAAMQRTEFIKSSSEDEVEMDPFLLFPAAKVSVGFTAAENVWVKPYWVLDPNENPVWAIGRRISGFSSGKAELTTHETEVASKAGGQQHQRRRTLRSYESARELLYRGPMCPGERYSIHVPAGVNLQLELRPSFGREEDWTPFTIPQRINLKQGQSLDLGNWEIFKLVPVVVRVVNKDGLGIEGIPVVDSQGPGWTRTTSIDGTVRFKVHAHSRGLFRVTKDYRNYDSVAYRVGGEEDAQREFELAISDDTINALFGG